MNIALFIVKRLVRSTTQKNKLSRPILYIGVIAIALGIVVMLVSMATGLGLQRKIQDKISSLNGHVSISAYHTRSVNALSSMSISLSDSIVSQLNALENVQSLYPTVFKQTLVRTDTDFEGVICKGVDASFNFENFKPMLVSGRLPDYSTEKPNKEVFISSFLANRLNLIVGDQLVCYFIKQQPSKNPKPYIRAFSIVGIFDTGFLEFDKQYAFVHLAHLQKLHKWKPNQYSQFEVVGKDFQQIEKLTNQVIEIVPPLVQSRSIKRVYAVLFEWLALFDMNIIGIISVMILVSAINMITVLLVLILERTQMIGLLKALGISSLSLRMLFLYYAMYLIGKGLFWGNLIGLSLCALQYFFEPITLDPTTYYVNTAPIYLSIPIVIAVNLGTFILCLFFLIVPTYVVSKVNPIKTIKYA